MYFEERTRKLSFNLTIFKEGSKELTLPKDNLVKGKYINLKISQKLWDYVDGPAATYKIADTDDRLMSKTINFGYNFSIVLSPLPDTSELKLPLLYSRIFPLTEDSAENQRTFSIIMQDSSRQIIIYNVKEIGGEIQSSNSESFMYPYTLSSCIYFQ